MVTLIVEQPSASVLSVDPVTPATMSADEAIMISVNLTALMLLGGSRIRYCSTSLIA